MFCAYLNNILMLECPVNKKIIKKIRYIVYLYSFHLVHVDECRNRTNRNIWLHYNNTCTSLNIMMIWWIEIEMLNILFMLNYQWR